MHYRNGREAVNGDLVIQFEMDSGRAVCVGTLTNAQPGPDSDYCNGNIEAPNCEPQLACLCDCLHVDDVEALLAAADLDHRKR